jgi:hypothetical protein
VALYKPVEIKAENRQGEDWAEKVVSEVGGLLGIPCAEIALAVRRAHEGLVSRDVKPRGWDLQLGAAVLDGVVEGYESRAQYRAGHTITNIELALRDMGPPPGRAGVSGFTAYDTFCGYLVLDALVANRHGHDHNWAVIIPPTIEAPCLAASFDHASSLGFGLTDESRTKFLSDADRLARWAGKGTASRFEHQAPTNSIETLVDLAARALAAASPLARSAWQGAIAALKEADFSDIVDETLGMSELAGTFAVELLKINRLRLLDAWA